MGTGAFLVTFLAVKKSLAAEIRGQAKSSFILNLKSQTFFLLKRNGLLNTTFNYTYFYSLRYRSIIKLFNSSLITLQFGKNLSM